MTPIVVAVDAYALLAALETAREERGSGIPLQWSEIAQEMDIHSSTFSRLKQGRLPGPRTLRVIMDWLEVDASEFKIAGNASLPIGGRDEPWDGEAATNRVFEWATTDGGKLDETKLRSAFFFVDTSIDTQTRQAYKLPFCDVADGGLHIVPRGMSAVSGGHGIDRMIGASPSEKDAIKKKVCSIYKRIVEKYDDWPDCPFNPDGTRPDRKDRRNDNDTDGDEFKDYSPEQRDKMAKNGQALPDGSFPIADCADLKNAIQAIGRASDPGKAKTHIKKRKAALNCNVDLPDDWSMEEEPPVAKDEKIGDQIDEKTSGIVGSGSLSQSEDPRTQALVSRVAELLREGAVAVSIKHDLHPEVSAQLAALEPSFNDEDPEVAAAAMKQAEEIYTNADIRPRHVAIVDTAAFSNARLTLGEDGYSVNGPVTFEGIYTGDVRTLKYGSLKWDEELLPIPIIWDPENNDHDGVVVGYINTLERVDGMTSAVRPEAVTGEDIEAVTAAAGSSALPAVYFADFKPTKKVPLTVTGEDANGLRRVFGIAAPKGVCHRSDMGACFQYPGDVDQKHKGFHTGQLITLDDGSKIQPGALTLGGRHIDANLARQGVDFKETTRHRDDANTIFAMVRAWETPFGLAVSGVVMPGVDQDALLRAAASAPSVELWPAGRGRTLVGIHLVPTPAWPVAASADGDTQTLTTKDHVHVINPEGGFCAECGDDVLNHDELWASDMEIVNGTLAGRLDSIEASLKRMESALALVASDALTNVPLPDDVTDEDIDNLHGPGAAAALNAAIADGSVFKD